MSKARGDFARGVRAKMKSRSTVYAALFLLLMIGQQIYEAYKREESESDAPPEERSQPEESRGQPLGWSGDA